MADLMSILRLGSRAVAPVAREAPVGRVFHSSPHDFERFDMSKMGGGEGGQMFGAGMYFAENPAVSGRGGEYWKQFLGRFSEPEQHAATRLRAAGWDRQRAADEARRDAEGWRSDLAEADKYPGGYSPGAPEHPDTPYYSRMLALREQELKALEGGGIVGPRTYEVNINAPPSSLLQWELPLAQQNPAVQQIARDIRYPGPSTRMIGSDPSPTGEGFSKALLKLETEKAGGNREVGKLRTADRLLEAGVPGTKYLDAGSRGPTSDANQFAKQFASRDEAIAAAKRMLDVAQNHVQQSVWRNVIDELSRPAQTYNYVIRDPSILDILRKYGLAGMSIGGLGAAAQREQQ